MSNEELCSAIHDEEALNALKDGYEGLNKAVSSTLGPKGRNVVIYRGPYNDPITTKDGVTVARSYSTRGRFEKIGVQLAKSIASRSNDVAGDGTTSSTLMGYSFLENGVEALKRGAQAVWLKEGMGEAVEQTLKLLEGMAIPVRTESSIRDIATISANNDPELGRIIAEAIVKVGNEGTVTVDKQESAGVSLDFSEGYSWKNGFILDTLHPNGNPVKGTIYEDCDIVCVNDTLDVATEALATFLKPYLDPKNPKPVVFIVKDSTGVVLANIENWVSNNMLPIGVIVAPTYGDNQTKVLKDIAILTGGKVVNNLSEPLTDCIGHVDRIEVKNDLTVLYGMQGDELEVEARKEVLEDELSVCKVDIDAEDLRVRISSMSESIATIKVGAKSEFEQEEMIHRIEDALSATRAAIEEGIVPGGGLALFNCYQELTTSLTGDKLIGFNIVRDSLIAPLTKILSNGGYDYDLVEDDIIDVRINSDKPSYIGFDAKEGVVCNLIEKGIIDPVKVTKTVMESAYSIAGLLMLTSCIIIPD